VRPGIPGLLRRNANFRRYFIGQSISLLGDQVSYIALPLTAVLALHATAGQMGALTTAYLLPNLLLSLHAGVWVDRSGRRREVMLAADVARGLLTATIPVAFALGHLTWTQLYVVAFLLGCASVVFYVSYGGFLQTIVQREDYISANTLINGTRGFSFLAGTSLGGVLVQLLRGPYALALDAVSFISSALALRRIDAADPPGAAR
jgi:MFS family permease